jgi:uncharacterized protein YfaS (alpha-2-macroglobulin family)
MKPTRHIDALSPCRRLAAAIILCSGLAAAQEAPYTYKPADRDQLSRKGGESVMIMPVSFLREYDPVTVMFDKNRGPEGGGPLDNPGEFVCIKPAHPGEYRWLDGRTIEFKPTIPWKVMQSYTVKSMGESKTLAVLLSPPQGISPASGTSGIDPVSRIEIVFGQAVAPEILSRLVTFETCPLPGIESKNGKVYGPSDYRIKPSEKSEGALFRYSFIFQKPFANGLRVRTIVRLTDDPLQTEARRIYYFDTRSLFTIHRAGTYEYQFTLNPSGITFGKEQALRLSREANLIIDFSEPPAALSLTQVKTLLGFSPAPRRMDWSLSGSRLTVRLSVDQERLYNVKISSAPIADKDGRTLRLDRPCGFFCYQPLDNQFSRWGKGCGVVERYGPQHFPLLVNGVKSLDLRVYKIDPVHSAFSPFPERPVQVNESAAPPGPGEEPPQSGKILTSLSAWEIAAHLRMLGSPPYSSVIDLDKEGISRFQSIDLKPVFAKISGPEKPGAYLVGFRPLDGSTERSFIRVLVTDLCLSTVESKREALFAVTSFSTGKPVEGADILVEAIVGRNNTQRSDTLIRGRTGGDGRFVAIHDAKLRAAFAQAGMRRVIVKKGDDLLVFDGSASVMPQEFANNHWRSAGSSWLNWFSSDVYDFNSDKSSAGFVFTERPIYRPNETVYFKGYARCLLHGKILAPDPGKKYALRIESPSGQTYNFTPRFSSFNSFCDSMTEPDLPTGEYQLRLMESESVIAATSFGVESYRLPKFEVKLFGPDKVPNDRPVSIRCIASYFAGGKVTSQEAAWKVVSYPFSYEPAHAAGYILSTDSRYGAVAPERQQGVIEQKDKTDDNGSASIVVNPQSATDGNPRKYSCEVTVTDEDAQTVSNRFSFVALPPFALGLKVQRHITGTSTIGASIVAVGISGDFEAGRKVSVELKKMSWTSYLQETDFSRGKPKYITQESVNLIAEKTLTTAKTPVSVEFTNQDPGVYIVEASSHDKLGRLQSVRADLFLAGKKSVTWKRGDQQLFETVPDRDHYEPGQQAGILIKSPFQRGLALAVIERPAGTPDYRWVEIADGQGTLTVPIESDMAPKIPISFLLSRPRIGDEKKLPDGYTVDAGKPQTVANTTWLKVDQVDNILKVSLDHPQTVRPGTSLQLDIGLKDGRGSPRGGEVALWLVDEAVLSLAKEKPLDPLPSFTPDVRSWITLRDSRNQSLGDLRIPLTPGGDGGEGGEDAFGKVTVRKNFKTVPYFNPAIIVDNGGKTTVTIPLSDDLTNFAVRAVAASSSDRFGLGKSQIRVRLPVIIQPALPRFVRLGDKIRAGGVARVVEGTGGPAAYTIEAQGLTAAAGSAPVDFTLPDAKAQLLNTDFTVADPGFDGYGILKSDSVTVKMAVVRKSDKASDAFRVSIPLRMDRPFEEDDKFAAVTPGKPLVIAAIPEKTRSNTLSRQILLSDQMAILKAVSGMTSLVRYPYGCTEQQISRVYPAVAYRDIWTRYGLEPPMGNIKKYVAQTMEYLASAQTTDGQFSYWPGTQGYVYLTAYVVEFLNEIKTLNEKARTNYPFSEAMYNKAIDALTRSLRTDYTSFVDGYKYFERSCALLALAKAGKLDIGYARELANWSENVDVQSMARICEALQKNAKALKSEITSIDKKLWKEAVFKLDNGKEVFAGLQERSFTIGARVHTDEITALASMISAFSSQEKRPEKLPQLVNELVTLGGDNDWGSTQANCLSLLALRDYVDQPTGKSRYSGTLTLGVASEPITYDSKSGALVKKWKDPAKAEFKIESSSDNTPCLVRFSQRYLPQEPGFASPSVQKGFVVKRELIFVNPKGQDRRVRIDSARTVHKLNIGDIIEEHIQVQNPKDRFFVAVSAPFAAGLEFMNPALETSGEDAKPKNATTNSGTYQMFLDDQSCWFFENMPAGTYDFYFRERASVAGEFSHPSARAEMMYEMATYGCCPGVKIVIRGE